VPNISTSRRPKTSRSNSAQVTARVRSQNKKLLRWLDSWLATPDDRGEDWWNEYEADLQSNRVTLRRS